MSVPAVQILISGWLACYIGSINQPCNMVVIDVFAQAEPGNLAASSNPSAIQTPVTVTGNLNGLTTTTTSNGQTIITATDTTGDKPGNAAGHTGALRQAGR